MNHGNVLIKLFALSILITIYKAYGIVQLLISDRASFINGLCMVVDGGYTNVDVIMMEEASGQLRNDI